MISLHVTFLLSHFPVYLRMKMFLLSHLQEYCLIEDSIFEQFGSACIKAVNEQIGPTSSGPTATAACLHAPTRG